MPETDPLKEIHNAVVDIVNELYQSEYKVVVASTPAELEESVNEYLVDDWRCVGGVSAANSFFYQAIVR